MHQNLLRYLFKKIHFTYLQQYDKNHSVILQEWEKGGGNVTMHAQHSYLHLHNLQKQLIKWLSVSKQTIENCLTRTVIDHVGVT